MTVELLPSVPCLRTTSLRPRFLSGTLPASEDETAIYISFFRSPFETDSLRKPSSEDHKTAVATFERQC